MPDLSVCGIKRNENTIRAGKELPINRDGFSGPDEILHL